MVRRSGHWVPGLRAARRVDRERGRRGDGECGADCARPSPHIDVLRALLASRAARPRARGDGGAHRRAPGVDGRSAGLLAGGYGTPSRALPAPTRWASASRAPRTCPTSPARRRRSRLAVLTVWSSPAPTAAYSSPSACSTRRMRRSMGSFAAKVSSPLQQCWPVRTTTPLEAPGAVTLDGARSAAQGGRASRRSVASARLSHRRRHDSSASLTRRRRSRTRGAVSETARAAAPGPCRGAAVAG